MGCGTSSAVAAAAVFSTSNVKTKNEVKDAECQTTVTHVRISANVRNEAYDLRKQQVVMHRAAALARAQEISNTKCGYSTETYTGSVVSTPRSATYSRTYKQRASIDIGSDIGNRSKTDSDGSTITNMTSRKSQVSFRNEKYKRLMTSQHKKRRRSHSRSILKPALIASCQSPENSKHSLSSSSVTFKDTGYEGSDEYQASVPSVIVSSPIINNNEMSPIIHVSQVTSTDAPKSQNTKPVIQDTNVPKSEREPDPNTTKSKIEENKKVTKSEIYQDTNTYISEIEQNKNVTKSEREQDTNTTKSEIDQDINTNILEIEQNKDVTKSEIDQDTSGIIFDNEEINAEYQPNVSSTALQQNLDNNVNVKTTGSHIPENLTNIDVA